jgi:hypothetical protein
MKRQGKEKQDPDVLSLGGGLRLELVVEGEGGRLGLALVMICLRLQIPFSIGVSS